MGEGGRGDSGGGSVVVVVNTSLGGLRGRSSGGGGEVGKHDTANCSNISSMMQPEQSQVRTKNVPDPIGLSF